MRSTIEKRLECLELTVSRNMNVKDVAGEGSEGSNEHIIGNWSQGRSLVCGSRNLEKFCPSVRWKTINQSKIIYIPFIC